MTYYLRYVITDEREVMLPELERALKGVSKDYEIDGDLILLKDEMIGQIEINKDDELFEDDLEVLQDFAEQKQQHHFLKVELEKAKSLVTVQAIWSLGNERTLQALEPLFEWLLDNRAGIFAGEGGCFYKRDGQVL